MMKLIKMSAIALVLVIATGPAIGTLLTHALASAGNADGMKLGARDATVVAAVPGAVHAFEKCVFASLARDGCSGECGDIDTAQVGFEMAMEEFAKASERSTKVQATLQSFTATPTFGAAPLIVNFAYNETLPPGAILAFGDGTSGSMNAAPICATCNPKYVTSHTYVSGGTYTAGLVQSGSGAIVGTLSITVSTKGR